MSFFRSLNRLFDPVRVHFLFESREYFLGETIEIAVQVITRDRLGIREMKAELRWSPVGANKREFISLNGPGPYVHSVSSFGDGRTLRAGSEESFSADLVTSSSTPGDGTLRTKWKVAVSVQSTDGRTYEKESSVKIVPRSMAGISDLRNY
jgi:hypothetical protein